MKKLLLSILMLLCLIALPACGGFELVDEADYNYGSYIDEAVEEQTEAASEIYADEDEDYEIATEAITEAAVEITEAITEAAEEITEAAEEITEVEAGEEKSLDKNGTYSSKEDVALYIHIYNCLPSNYISKKDAQALGWSGGSLERYAPGKCIGGSRFGNYEGLLPKKDGRTYTECDIDTLGASKRGAKRIVFSNDGLIYYTDDHYESFELLYGEE